MSVDFNACEYCGESIIDEYCYGRIIDGMEVTACKYCIDDEIKSGKLIEIDEESAEFDMLTDEEKDDIDNYGRIYKRTDDGIKERLAEIEEEIKSLQEEKEDLLKRCMYNI